jgi:hypothetical protein
MRSHRLDPRRGLLAGLLALVVSASSAVAMTVGGPSAGTSGSASTNAPATQNAADTTVQGTNRLADDDGGDRDRDGFRHRDGGGRGGGRR